MNIIYAGLALLCGVVLTSQVGCNAVLGKALADDYIPGAVNMLVGIVTTVLLLLAVHQPWPSAAVLREAPTWSWVAGGVLGTVYLTGNILLAPKLGAAALVGLVVTGQLLFAVLADNYGWLGFAQHSLSPTRVIGCALMVGGVTLISKF